MARRDDILTAVYEAGRLHKEYETEARAKVAKGGSTSLRCWSSATSP